MSGKISAIIVAKDKTLEVITGDLKIKHLTMLPEQNWYWSIIQYEGAIMLCGAFYDGQKCVKLDHGIWKDHSTLNEARYGHTIATTKSGIFLFGGLYSRTRNTYEYLPKGSTSWLMGKTEIPGGFLRGCAIAVKSDQEIWLIGGLETTKRILSFDVNDHTFKELPFQLNVGRKGHRCALIPNTNKVMVTGGDDNSSNDTMWILNSTEILDTEDGSVTMASPMNSKRSIHGMGVLTINREDRLAVFGGYSGTKSGGFDGRSWLDSVETYNTQAEKWETSDIKLSEEKDIYGSLTVKISDIFSELQSIND